MSSDESESAMLPQPVHHDDDSPERHDPVPFSEAELEWRFRCRNSLEGARRCAMRTALLGPLLLMAMLVVMAIGQREDQPLTMTQRSVILVTALLVVVLIGIIYSFVVGVVSGSIAHRFAFETTIPVSRLAIVLAWVANLSLWGWSLVGLLSSR